MIGIRTRIDEVAAGITRLATPTESGTLNQFLIDAEEPLLYHCGTRDMFGTVCEAVETVMPIHRLRWISFAHVAADEMGAMNLWLAVAPRARVVHGPVGARCSIADLADRAVRTVSDGETVELGGRRVRLLETPHLPRNQEAIMLFEEVTATLFCGDLGANDRPAPWTEDLAGDASVLLDRCPDALAPGATDRLRHLAGLAPRQLAVKRGASFRGQGALELRRLADLIENHQGEVT